MQPNRHTFRPVATPQPRFAAGSKHVPTLLDLHHVIVRPSTARLPAMPCLRQIVRFTFAMLHPWTTISGRLPKHELGFDIEHALRQGMFAMAAH